jgi:hypothetical protein
MPTSLHPHAQAPRTRRPPVYRLAITRSTYAYASESPIVAQPALAQHLAARFAWHQTHTPARRNETTQNDSVPRHAAVKDRAKVQTIDEYRDMPIARRGLHMERADTDEIAPGIDTTRCRSSESPTRAARDPERSRVPSSLGMLPGRQSAGRPPPMKTPPRPRAPRNRRLQPSGPAPLAAAPASPTHPTQFSTPRPPSKPPNRLTWSPPEATLRPAQHRAGEVTEWPMVPAC